LTPVTVNRPSTVVKLKHSVLAQLYLHVLDDQQREDDADIRGWLIVSAVASLAAALLLRFVPATESDPGPATRAPCWASFPSSRWS